jgi:hypothetical protein
METKMENFKRLQQIFKNRGINLYIITYQGFKYLMGDGGSFFDGNAKISTIDEACQYARIWYRFMFFQF